MESSDLLSFRSLPIPGAFAISTTRSADERGWFARSWSSQAMEAHGLSPVVAESSLSHNTRAGTLRGLHYQAPPAAEAKLVTCVRGRMWDVIVDLRRDSATFGKWHAEELNAEVGDAIYIPEGLAHGFLTLTDDVTVLYQISTAHAPELARGIRWDDPTLAIDWPSVPIVMSARDRGLPNLTPDPD